MKKRSLAIILALVLVMAFGTSAFAAQAISGAGFGGFNAYQATPTYSQVYSAGAVVYGANYFNPDGKSNYPYEIYLPNEAQPANYRIHTNYTKNTDACASCHATHTAVGASLLQWYSTYETCMACHDGTVTTTYDVESGTIAGTSHYAFGGAFGNGSEAYASQHNVQGSVSIAAAPGGSVVGKDVNAGSKTITMWTSSFGCESCHTPHGQGGNARILNPDPNGYASLNNKKVYTVEAVTGAVYDGSKHVTLIKGYPYLNTFAVNGVADATYVIDNTAGYSVIKTNAGVKLPVAATATGTASVQVTMNIQNYLTVNEQVYHMSGINTFCGTCHTDYNTEAQVAVNGSTTIMGDSANRPGYGALTGEYSKAHRHAVGLDYNYGGSADQKLIGNDKLMVTMQGNISCLTCHFAHGTNQDFWLTTAGAADNFFTPADKRTELAGSSALKRLPNMGTCEACHQKADANQGYAANSNTITSGTPDLGNWAANATHEAYFAGNTYKDATTCLICHASAGDDYLKSVHWNIGGPSNVNKDFFGGLMEVKDGVVFTPSNGFTAMPFGMSDRFCGFPGGAAGVSFAYNMIDTNGNTQEGNSCGKCHTSINTGTPPMFQYFFSKGQGQSEAQIKAANLAKIDCLACHLSRKDYDSMLNKKVLDTPQGSIFIYATGAQDRGGNLATTTSKSNTSFTIAKVGKDYKIAMPTNENCMTCHEHAMAGPVYKRHALYSKGTDIHAAENMECVDCHSTSRHLIAKGIQATDLVANDRPEVEVACVSSKCHGAAPHKTGVHTNDAAKVAELNTHAQKLACQSCHVNTEKDSYADAAMAYVNNSQLERGYPTTFAGAQSILFKGGAIFNDFRSVANSNSLADGVNSLAGFNAKTVGSMTYGHLGSIPEAGFSEWMAVQPGNFAWRWFNGTGTGMANAVASFGFYDAFNYNDGFKAFRGTEQFPSPAGFGAPFAVDSYAATTQAQAGAVLSGLFGNYWSNYDYPPMYAGANTFDKEFYQGPEARRGGNGDKIYPFRKMQAWMPVPRTNFWFLTPHDMKTMKDAGTDNTARNYLALKKAIESPMMYMFFSEMFRPTMDLYAQEFGFTYMYTAVTVDGTNAPDYSGTNHPMYQGLAMGLGGMAPYVVKLNGFIYDSKANWLDSNAKVPGGVRGNYDASFGPLNGQPVSFSHGMVPMGIPMHETNASAMTNAQAQAALVQGDLNTYMYFPMPLDANIMEDHAIAAKGFTTDGSDYATAGAGVKYEPRTCQECHKAPNGGTAATAKSFDNPNWNPLAPMTISQDALAWGSNYTGLNIFDWVTLGYSQAEIQTYTGAGIWDTPAWN